MSRLLDLADVARLSGLRVVELPGWQENYSPGGEEFDGTLAHHTGAYDEIGDLSSDYAYAMWLAFTGRPDLAPPLCNLALSAECVVYVCSSGNANHAGEARATGPMPAAKDGNRLYIGIEAMNSGTQGWLSKGKTADGEEITQGEAYIRLCAALAVGYGWPASHTRGHRETSVTGKVDPGGIDLNLFRSKIEVAMKWIGGDELKPGDAEEIAKAVLSSKMEVKTPAGKTRKISVEQALREVHQMLKKEEN